MISIDQVVQFFSVYQIGRWSNRNRIYKRDKFAASSVFLSDRMIRKAFYLSKMTVSDEHKDGPLEFTHLKMVEFLEFIGRLSYMFYETTPNHKEWELPQKMTVMLGWMFKPLNLTLVIPEEHNNFISDSDDDY